MNTRLKELRTHLGLSQEAFGETVGVTKAAISRIESGTNSLSDRMILSITTQFNVNEEWLRTGNGEMFNNLTPDEELAYIVGNAIPAASDYVKDTFIALGKLSKEFSKEDWEVVKKFVDALAGK
ncbi:helix-turn-helix domain-containing protein [Konateibacter massiliensis]|uniref:helix-turn-helix domain-containing protein n=1 Tax=Konateibacter massiliensis TaxID=2002841 RepID=UPI000C15FF09|nr:helix-turn-helix transcriptional regulator [Konateibacter massiliensis]